ncbi:class I lanthipeptide [Pontibacter sp. HSC-14F20]|uniref:class I lanthipeptide n=1 Tax=Pontibacter sp. HSC-14F20 TaxID=2864136 RepID=UPI001C72F266|nr:class I lanthipeptide [Pontibacter sp. HSC-14F20]MBX0335332.1 class I lanthipeptide [Pontibacter sp. HSC-14F20]
MKKKNVSPLNLDKETIARLDQKQLDALAGGAGDPDSGDEATCFIATRNTIKSEDELEPADPGVAADCCITKD